MHGQEPSKSVSSLILGCIGGHDGACRVEGLRQVQTQPFYNSTHGRGISSRFRICADANSCHTALKIHRWTSPILFKFFIQPNLSI
mmetsp:Transcript_57940/g.167994  ORF Transcript_57940/g.167994 Transcript_57940/m.167994 type:complete len:86 (-) Transcript_57940:1626-1883(-)